MNGFGTEVHTGGEMAIGLVLRPAFTMYQADGSQEATVGIGNRGNGGDKATIWLEKIFAAITIQFLTLKKLFYDRNTSFQRPCSTV